MAVDAGQFEILKTFSEVVSFLLRTYATDKVVTDILTNVDTFLKAST